MSSNILTVTSSRILGVRRVDPLRFSVGDEAIIEFGAGLLRFLDLLDSSGRRLGEGLAPEWAIPVGAALTAAQFTMESHRQPSWNNWPLVSCSVEWRRPCHQDEKLIAVSRIVALGRSSVTQHFCVYSHESKQQILQGKSVSVSVGPNGPVPFIANFFGPDENATGPESGTSAQPSPPAERQLAPAEHSLHTGHDIPILQALVAKPQVRSLDGKIMIYPIVMPAPNSPVSSFQPLRVKVQAPPTFKAGEINCMTIRAKGKPIIKVEPVQNSSIQIEFLASAREGYELVIQCAQARTESLCPGGYEDLWSSVEAAYEEAPEDQRPDLFRLEWPSLVNKTTREPERLNVGDKWEWVFPTDLFRLLVNPLAGGAEPLGRRMHPVAAMEIGTAIYAALESCGPGLQPQTAELHCTAPVSGRAPFRLHQQLLAAEQDKLVFENSLAESDTQVARLQLTFAPASGLS